MSLDHNLEYSVFNVSADVRVAWTVVVATYISQNVLTKDTPCLVRRFIAFSSIVGLHMHSCIN